MPVKYLFTEKHLTFRKTLSLLFVIVLFHGWFVFQALNILVQPNYTSHSDKIVDIRLIFGDQPPANSEQLRHTLKDRSPSTTQPKSAKPSHEALTPTPAPKISKTTVSSNPLVIPPQNLAAIPREWRPYPVNPPPSVELAYRTDIANGAQHLALNSRIRWQNTSETFKIQGELGTANGTAQTFISKGRISPTGILPSTYAEQQDSISVHHAQFLYDEKRIEYSRSGEKAALAIGTQDAASVFWQLASIGRNDSSPFQPGTEFQMDVADAQGADTWKFQVIKLENIQTAVGPLSTWHLTRAPVAGKAQVLDVWLAPEHNWYPVKLRYTEPNGDFVEMTVTSITPIADS